MHKRYSSPNISEKKVSSSLNNKQCFTDNPLFYLTSEKKPVVYILLLEKKCTGFPQSFTFLQSEGFHSKTSSSPRIGTGQECGALVTRGCLSHTHPLGGEPMVPLSLAAKEGVHPQFTPKGNTAVCSIGTMDSPEIPSSPRKT